MGKPVHRPFNNLRRKRKNTRVVSPGSPAHQDKSNSPKKSSLKTHKQYNQLEGLVFVLESFLLKAKPQMATGKGEDVEFLKNQLEEIQQQLEEIRRDNDLASAFYKLNEEAVVQATETAEKKGKSKKSKLKVSLDIENKLEMATAVQGDLTNQLAQTKKAAENLIDTQKAVIEARDLRISELKKEAYEFKRDIVVGAENFRTGKTMAEKVIRYMEEKLRHKDTLTEKLRLKNTSLKGTIRKVDNQLKQKEEMGDVLHYIDFHQLQIENKQYVAKIEERNQELLSLKMTTGNTVQVLNVLKTELAELLVETEWLQKEIAQRTDLLHRITNENGRVEEDTESERRLNVKLVSQQDDTAEMPQVLDYVTQRAELSELESAVTNWMRKVEIAEMGSKKSGTRRATAPRI